VCFVSTADLELEQLQMSHEDPNSPAERILLFRSPSSSDEESPLIWDPMAEAFNKHVALSQADSGN